VTDSLRVAILGGTGFAGHNTRNELERAGIAVGVFSRTSGCDLLDRPAAWAKLDAFRRIFRNRFGVEADTYAAHGYDGMNMLIWATQVAGLNRAKIRDVLAYRSKPWPGVTGQIALSAALDDVGTVTLARFEAGKWNYYTRESLEIPQGPLPARDRVSESAAKSETD